MKSREFADESTSDLVGSPKSVAIAEGSSPHLHETELAVQSAYCQVSKDGSVCQPYSAELDTEVERAFQLGATIHERYRLTGNLGRGGMGRVFLARDELLDRLVAVKVVGRGPRDAPAREARLVASLSDPGIAAVFDFGIFAGNSFIIFEYVAGSTLRQVLQRCEKLPLDEVQQVVAALAQSLDHAHSAGVVHRDLKPENVCLAANSRPKILDFGIARDLRSYSDFEEFCGTPQYASPEQAAGLPVDGRTDQYALALMAYEMLAGRKVFVTENVLDLLRLHRECEPDDIRRHCPDLPEPVAQALHRALHKAPNQRFATCQEFARAFLAEAAERSEQAATPLAVPVHERVAAYICHASEDSLIARQLGQRLARHGYSAWYYERDALPGLSLAAQTAAAIQRANVVLLLISHHSLHARDIARDIQAAHRAGRGFVPVLIGMTTEEFQNHQPSWRAMLGPATVIEFDRSQFDHTSGRVVAALEALGVDRNAPAAAAPDQSPRRVSGQVWATDASQIDIHDLRHVVFRSDSVEEFLTRRNKYFLSGCKGLGKTLLLTYKRHLITEAADSEDGLCLVPTGRPYLDFMSEMRSISARYERPLSELTTTKRFWSLALRVSAIAHHPAVIEADEARELELFPPRMQRWLTGTRIEPTLVFKELTDLPVGQANSLVDETENFLDQKLRRIHSSTFFFVDKVDQAVRKLPRAAWINIQAGLIEAAWDLMNANSHVKVFASIRHEAFVNYESDIKANLFGATTILRYSDQELEDLMNRLAECYESSLGFKDFVGLNVVKHERRAFPEDSFRFLRRHSLGRPRDLVAMASELSAQRSSLTETRYCELVQRTSASGLAPSLFDEMSVFLDCLGDREARFRFLAEIPANILRYDDAVAVCARFNGIPVESVPAGDEGAESIFHPFQDLYMAGLLGVLARGPGGERSLQRFRRPDDLVTAGSSQLPKSPFYFLHPALTGLIDQHRRTAEFLMFEHVVVGDGAAWEPRDERFCEVERHAAKLTSPELRAATHQLLKLARELLRGHGAGDLRRTFPALPEWQELRRNLLAARADDVVLWMEELIA